MVRLCTCFLLMFLAPTSLLSMHSLEPATAEALKSAIVNKKKAYIILLTAEDQPFLSLMDEVLGGLKLPQMVWIRDLLLESPRESIRKKGQELVEAVEDFSRRVQAIEASRWENWENWS